MIEKHFGKLLAVCVLVILVFFIWLFGSSNPFTPGGYSGYVTQGAVFGEKRFVKTQQGPTSPGRHWLYDVANVSITPYTTTEPFLGENGVLSKDNLHVDFQVHVVWRVKPDGTKDLIEKYSTIVDDTAPELRAYANFVKEPLRTLARNEIQSLPALQIKDNILEINKDLLGQIREYCAPSPFEIMSVVVGNIQYPKEVSDQVSLKMSATQILERKAVEIEQERMDAQKRVVQAEGIAKSMAIINNELTAAYLQHEAIESQKVMAGSPNHTTVYIPVGNNGLPLVGAVGLGK